MLTVAQSSDFDYFRSLMKRPALRRACAGCDCDDSVVELALKNRNAHYYEARDGENRLGFVVFILRSPAIADFHTCLLTIGSRTREAARRAISAMAARGLRQVLAVYPNANRAAHRFICDLGFVDAPDLRNIYPDSIQATHQFKELRCPG